MNTYTPFQTLMREATRLTQAGQLQAATQALQRALGGSMQPSIEGGQATKATRADDSSLILDGCVFKTVEDTTARTRTGFDQETFTGASHTHAGITRRYKLYTPPRIAGHASALIVMLHGCTQNPDDFAAGTGMNALAREQGFMVLYPEQAQDANPQRCWNWFKHNHQKRGSGEPALIANLAQTLARQHGIDPHRIYVAGLSAGGAMAAIVATEYPDVFAAVGVHSGLPSGAAGNVTEALMAMKNGSVNAAMARNRADTKALVRHVVPTIVFHGDKDQTVHPRNGKQVLAAVLASQVLASGSVADAATASSVEQRVSQLGRRFTRTTYQNAAGAPLAEHWVLHGAGHAWSGGSAVGSYTDPTGPDATREMVRFFFSR